MRRNFQFDVMTMVKWADSLIDLHNSYDLEAFGTNHTGSEFEIVFGRNRHAIPAHQFPQRATLRCRGNVRVAFNDLCEIAAPINDEGIEIAYFNDDCDWDHFLTEDVAQQWGAQGLDIRFINGLVVRVFCEEALFSVQ